MTAPQQKPHVWLGERCIRCEMRRDWAGARYACEGVADLRRTLSKRPAKRGRPVRAVIA